MKKFLDSGILGFRNSWIRESLDDSGQDLIPHSRFFSSSCSEFQTPVPKRLRALPGSPSQNSRSSRGKLFASQIQWSPSSEEEENRENEAFPRKTQHSRRLDIPDGNPGIPRDSHNNSHNYYSHNSQAPVGAFYGKRTYLDPLERKRLRELLGAGNIPGKAGNILGKAGNSSRKSGNPSRNRSSKGKSNIKGRQEIPNGKSSGNSGAGNSQISRNSWNSVIPKKAELPLRVLLRGVRPALRLPLGSAFFQSGKRSRKNPGNPGADPKNPPGKAQEKSGKAENSGSEERKETPGRISDSREEEKENRECSMGCEKSGNGAGNSGNGGVGSGAEGKEVSAGIGENSRDFQEFWPWGGIGWGRTAGIAGGKQGWDFPWEFWGIPEGKPLKKSLENP